MNIKIATWNISGGVSKDVSVENYFDQEKEAEINKTFLNEIIRIINEKEIDIFTFQEIITTDRIAYLEQIKENTKLKYVSFLELSECNLVENTDCGIAIFSRFPINNSRKLVFQNPNLSITTSKGATYYTYDKGCLSSEIEILDKKINIITNHGFPLRRFGGNPIDHQNIFDEFQKFIFSFQNVILTGDFNVENVYEVMPKVEEKLTKIFNEVTTTDGKKFDKIYVDKSFKVIDKETIHSLSDHFLCISTIMIEK